MGHKMIAGAVALALAGGGTPAAAGPAPTIGAREAEVPLEVSTPTPTPTPAPAPAPEAVEPPPGPAPVDVRAEGSAPARPPPVPTRIDPASAPLQVAIGLGPTAAGSADERAILDDLERTLAASTAPRLTVRRLRAGASEPRSICRQRRDDLVVVVDYLPEREAPVLVPHDCALDQALGVRAVEAAREPELAQVLWAEHTDLVRRGVRERRPPLVAPRTRRFLIAGGAIVALGVALGFILSATLRPGTVVVTVSP